MRHLPYIIFILISNIVFSQSDDLYSRWTNGIDIYWAERYNDSLVLFEGGNLHEGGAMFTLQRVTKDSLLLIGGHPEQYFNPTFGAVNDRVTLKTIHNTKILIFQDSNGLTKYVLREMRESETLQDVIIRNKINHELAGGYIDNDNNAYFFYANEKRVEGLTDKMFYSFGYEYDFPINVLVFDNMTAFYYEVTAEGLEIYKAKIDDYTDWVKAEKVKSLTKTEWINSTDNKRLKGKYPFVSTEILIDDILSSYDKQQLKIMRNEIFARHGYIFKTSEMINYFETQDWYIPKYDDVIDKLTELEKLNIKLIQYFENL